MCQRVSAGRLAPNSQLFTVCTATQFRAIMNEKTRELACAGVSNYEPTRYHGRCHVASYMSSLSSNVSPTSVRRRPYGASNDTQRSKANALVPGLRDCSHCALSRIYTSGTGINIDTTMVLYSDWVVAMGNMRAIQRENCVQLRCAGAWVRGRPERPHVARVRKNYLFAERQQSYASEARGAGRALGSGSRKCP